MCIYVRMHVLLLLRTSTTSSTSTTTTTTTTTATTSTTTTTMTTTLTTAAHDHFYCEPQGRFHVPAVAAQDDHACRGGRVQGIDLDMSDMQPRQGFLTVLKGPNKLRLERRDAPRALAFGGGPPCGPCEQLRNRKAGCERLCGRVGQHCSDACASLGLGMRPTNGCLWWARAGAGHEQRPERWQLARALGPPCELLCGCELACEWF
jgi:hypothetical protein